MKSALRTLAGAPPLPYPFTLNPDWSFRFSDDLVALDGGGNIQSAVSETNPADILAQGTAADRPFRDAATYARPCAVGDAISDQINGAVSFGGSNSFTSFVAGYAPQNVRTMAGLFEFLGAAAYWRHTPGGGAFRVWLVNGPGTAATSNALVAGAFWHSFTKDPTAVGTEVRSRDSNGGDGTNTPDRSMAGTSVGCLCADIVAGITPGNWSNTPIAWWFGYNRVLTPTEHAGVANYLVGWL
jgi:hypothetical protein